jgi:glycosyltransferase involved in cell wall biosynthesis
MTTNPLLRLDRSSPTVVLPNLDRAPGRPLRLALYHPWIYLQGGVERTILELLNRSRHDWTVYTHHYDRDATFPGLADHDIRELGKPISVRRSLGPLTHAGVRIASTRLPTAGERALLVSSEGLGDLAVARARVPAVAYCHTPLKILHDPVNRARLTSSRPMIGHALKVLGPGFNAVDRRMWRRYQHAFANSAETRTRIGRAGLADPADVEVLHPGVDTDRFAFGHGRRDDAFLVAGRIMWQKNIELAIDAIADARRRGSTAELVIAGAVDAKSRDYLASLRERAAGLPVRFVVDPTDDELRELYQRCKALLFTPENEDWGIVPLEAMSCGTPVLAVDAGGPRESVVDGVSGWLLPADAAAFGARMRTVETLPAAVIAEVRRATRRRALAFGWESFTARIDAVMEATVAEAEPQSQLSIASRSTTAASSQVHSGAAPARVA